MDLPSVAQETERACISTGHLPAPEVVRMFLSDPHQSVTGRENPVGQRRSPFLAAFPSSVKIEGDT
jgi:hypothetical protein